MRTDYFPEKALRTVCLVLLAITINSCSANRNLSTEHQDLVTSDSNHKYLFNTKVNEYNAFLSSDFESSPIFQESSYQQITRSNTSRTITNHKYDRSEANSDHKINQFFEGKSDFRSVPVVINFIAGRRHHSPFFETLDQPLVKLRYISACNEMPGPIVMNSRGGQPVAFLSLPNNSSCVKQLDPHRFGENKSKRLSVYKNSNLKRPRTSSFNRSRPVDLERTASKPYLVNSSNTDKLRTNDNSRHSVRSRSTRTQSKSVKRSNTSRSNNTPRAVSASGALKSSSNSRSVSR